MGVLCKLILYYVRNYLQKYEETDLLMYYKITLSGNAIIIGSFIIMLFFNWGRKFTIILRFILSAGWIMIIAGTCKITLDLILIMIALT